MQTGPTHMPESNRYFGLMPATLFCGFLLIGCSVFGDDEPSDTGPVRAERVGNAIVIQNRGRDTVWTFEVGQRVLARILWRPSLTEEGLPPGNTRTTALDSIPMDDEERVVVFWWEARGTAGQREPGEVSSLDVAL